MLNVLTDGAVRHFSGTEFQSLGVAQKNVEQQCPSCAPELTEADISGFMLWFYLSGICYIN